MIFILAIFTILLASCGTERPADDEMPLVEIYSLALDALMEEDKAFIAIGMEVTLRNENGKWKVTESKMNWISWEKRVSGTCA